MIEGMRLATVGLAQSGSDIGQTAFRVGLVVILAIAIYIRWLFFIAYGGLEPDYGTWAAAHYFGGVSSAYITGAQRIVDFVLQRASAQFPFSGSDPYPPGYPMLIAAIRLGGLESIQTVRIVQFTLESFAIFPLAYLLARMGTYRFVILFAALCYAAAPWIARGSTFIMAEALLTALVVCVLALLVWASEKPSPRRWIGLGLFSSVLPMFRPDTILLAGPLLVWALLVERPGHKIRSGLLVVLAFATFPLMWGLVNLVIGGRFVITSNAAWYNLWAGLGAFPNPFGFYTNDFRAQQELRAVGLGWNTPETEAYWRTKYIQAWAEHPDYVLNAIFWRIQKIAFDFEHIRGLAQWNQTLSIVGPVTLTAASVVLFFKRKKNYILIIWAPLVYAILSLGFVYVEPRYVRYVIVSYLLGATIVVNEAVRWSISFAVSKGLRERSMARVATGAAAIACAFVPIVTVANLAPEANAARNIAAVKALPAPAQTAPSPSAEQVPIQWTLGQNGVVVERIAPDTVRLRTAGGAGSYQMYARLPTLGAQGMRFDLEFTDVAGAFAVGAITADASRWIRTMPIANQPGIQSLEIGTNESEILLMVIHTNAEGRAEAIVRLVGVSRVRLCPPEHALPFSAIVTTLFPVLLRPCSLADAG